MIKKFKLFEDNYTNPFNPDEIWGNEVIIDEIDNHEVRYDLLDELKGKTIEFSQLNYGFNTEVGPVKLVNYMTDMPEDGDYEGYHFFINDKQYGEAERGVDYFDVDTSKKIKILD